MDRQPAEDDAAVLDRRHCRGKSSGLDLALTSRDTRTYEQATSLVNLFDCRWTSDIPVSPSHNCRSSLTRDNARCSRVVQLEHFRVRLLGACATMSITIQPLRNFEEEKGYAP
jgi:hypothetical protein